VHFVHYEHSSHGFCAFFVHDGQNKNFFAELGPAPSNARRTFGFRLLGQLFSCLAKGPLIRRFLLPPNLSLPFGKCIPVSSHEPSIHRSNQPPSPRHPKQSPTSAAIYGAALCYFFWALKSWSFPVLKARMDSGCLGQLNNGNFSGNRTRRRPTCQKPLFSLASL
jgi:hypothetical protein